MVDITTTPNASANSNSSWNLWSISYHTLGIVLGIALCFLGLSRSYQFIDSIWFQWLGDVKVVAMEQSTSPASDTNRAYYTTFEIPAQAQRKAFKLRIDDKKLYEYIQRSISPSSDRRVEAELVQRMLSRQPHLVRVGPIRLGNAPKSAELIVYIGLIVIGFMVAFTALRDIYKRWLRRNIS